MWYQLGVILLIIAFLTYLAAAFGSELAHLLINGTILFLFIYRGYYEFLAGRGKFHAVGAFAAFLLIIFFGNYGTPFWVLTTFVATAYAAAFLAKYAYDRKA